MTGELWKLTQQCLEPDPQRRPDITEVVSCLSRTLAIQPLRAHAKLDDASEETSDEANSFKSAESWNSQRNLLQHFRKLPARRFTDGVPAPLAKQDPHVAMDAHEARDPHHPQRSIFPTNADSPSTAASEQGAINVVQEQHQHSPSLQSMHVHPQNTSTPPTHLQTSASIPLMKIAEWDGVSQDIIQQLLDAFKAEDYLDCIRNLEGHGIEPSSYVNNLDKVCSSPI